MRLIFVLPLIMVFLVGCGGVSETSISRYDVSVDLGEDFCQNQGYVEMTDFDVGLDRGAFISKSIECDGEFLFTNCSFAVVPDKWNHPVINLDVLECDRLEGGV